MNRAGQVGLTAVRGPYVMTEATNVAPGAVLARLARGALHPHVAASAFVLANVPAQAHNGSIESYGGFGSYTAYAGIDPTIGGVLGIFGAMAGIISIVQQKVTGDEHASHFILGMSSTALGAAAATIGLDSDPYLPEKGALALAVGIASSMLGGLSQVLTMRTWRNDRAPR